MASRTQAIARAHGKELFVGEYGQFGLGIHACGPDIGKSCGGIDGTQNPSRRIVDTLVADDIAYGSLFAYESAPLNPSCPRDLSCGTVDSSPIVDYIAQRDHAYGACTGLPDGQGCPGGTCSAGICGPPITPAQPTTASPERAPARTPRSTSTSSGRRASTSPSPRFRSARSRPPA